MDIKICDLCGKPLDFRSRKFKVKEYKKGWEIWERIDVHEGCLNKLLNAVADKGEGRWTH